MLSTPEYIKRTKEIDEMSQGALLDDCLEEANGSEYLWLDTLRTLIDERPLSTEAEFSIAFNVAINDLSEAHQQQLRNKAMAEHKEYLDAVEERDKTQVIEHPAKSANDSIDESNKAEINGWNKYIKFNAG